MWAVCKGTAEVTGVVLMTALSTRQGATGHAEALWEAKLQDFAGKLIYKEGRGLGGPAFRRHLKG